ncbi:molybdopterin-binding protein [Candidatus Methanoperedens nitratireducens]|uniref:hypothetical protein n=1 Tax=Candidatus Methanoperedens nitratireducens TaxID=1392998 RepID=UPI00373AF425
MSTDDGRSFTAAKLGKAYSPYAATPWRFRWSPPHPSRYMLIARATDSAGNIRLLNPLWSAYGYGNNVAHRVQLTAR